MFNKKQLYIGVCDVYSTRPKTREQFQVSGIDPDYRYFIYEPEKWTEVDMKLIISNK